MTASTGGQGRAGTRVEGKPAGGAQDGLWIDRRTGAEMRANVRERLIESRLTPNSISMTGLVLNLVAAVLVTQRLFFLAGIASSSAA